MDPRVEAVRKIIEAEYQADTKVSELARRSGLSRSHLEFLFRKETGLTLKAWLRDVRLRKAAELLQGNGLGIKQVMFAVGYHDPSDFDRDFKSCFGDPPSAHRRDRRLIL